MSDFDESDNRIPDYEEVEEAVNERLVCCPQCNKPCGKWHKAYPATLETPGEPAECECYDGSVEDESGRLFCSEECKRIYEEA